ncbi:MAG: NF038122 family metalloprotease [Deltaproteobacteria bacterium]|nr:NF038122 family metalloprotease [Deltaproteobacteria bacterium]
MSKTWLPILVLPFLLLAGQEWGSPEAVPGASEPDLVVLRAAVGSHLRAREYWASETDEGLQAPNREHGLRTYFEPTGLRVHDRTAAGSPNLLELSLVGLGGGESLLAVPPGEIEHREGRIEIVRSELGLVEWYVNSRQGLEQGFTLASRPPLGAGDPSALALELAISGAKASLRGGSIVLTSEAGRTLEYGKLLVVDAKGTKLAAHFEVPSPDRIRLRVEDRGATYPIVIDPLLTGTFDALLESNQASSQLGFAVATAGDVNGDGYDDVIVGAPLYDAGTADEGAAFVFLGSAFGVDQVNPLQAHAQLEGNQLAAQMGNSVASAGDVNGDGYGDVIVGSALFNAGQADEGAAWIYLGSSTGIPDGGPATAHAGFESNQTNAQMGFSVATAGDVNGDGYDDVIVGAPFYDDGSLDEGMAFLYHGSATGFAFGSPTTANTRLASNQIDARFGVDVASAGDVDGDGLSDVIVGAHTYDAGSIDEGGAFVFRGNAAGIADASPATAHARLESNQANALFGFSVASAGDVNGDGLSDVIVGALAYDFQPGDADMGAAFVFAGSATGIADGSAATAATQIHQDQAGAQFGRSVASAGDVNGDGYSDLIVGAMLWDALAVDEGAVFVYLGRAAGIPNDPSVYRTLGTGQATSLLGIAVSSAGDVNGDGYDDVIVGANLHENGETDEGAAFVHHGGAAGGAAFNFTFLPGTSIEAQNAFEAAGRRWSAWLRDEVVVDLTVGTASLGTGVVVSSGVRRVSVVYSGFRSALVDDQTSPLDSAAVASLPAGSIFGVLINRTSDSPNGSGSATPYVDLSGANNSTISLTTANAKALGLAVGPGSVGSCLGTCDGSLVFANAFAYDYDPSDGISPGTYDLVGFATHEIGHVLGFVSGVDILDLNSPPVGGPFPANLFTVVSPLDLFRFSALSAASGVLDQTADTRSKDFSIDGGGTAVYPFATGRFFGDGQAAGHWKDGLGVGLMDPTGAQGEALAISLRDIQAFDAIGWNVVPEPDSGLLLGAGLVGFSMLATRSSSTSRRRRGRTSAHPRPPGSAARAL